ncbi:MAG: hypothetical protein MUO89_01895 [Dehalococcoidia bacterium]|nr:hypothetical protein [Dehalococcoidia bacterium]
MTKRNTSLATLIVGLIVLVQLIVGIGCLIGKSESSSLVAQSLALQEILSGGF